jgi:hypothetical protein
MPANSDDFEKVYRTVNLLVKNKPFFAVNQYRMGNVGVRFKKLSLSSGGNCNDGY